MNRRERLLGVRLFPIFRICITILFVAIAAQRANAAPPAFVLMNETAHLPVKSVAYMVEQTPLTPTEAASDAYADQWHTSDHRLNLGNFHPPVWLRFDITSQPDVRGDRYILEVGQQLLDRVEVYLRHHKNDHWSTGLTSGNALPHSVRTIRHRNHLFPVTIAPGETIAVYIRVASQVQLNVTADLWQSRAFWLHDINRVRLLGIFFGILMVMALYNGFLFVFTKDTNYLYYVVYMCAVILYELASIGTGSAYFWDKSIWIRQIAYPHFASLSFLAGTLFIRHFLSLKKYGGWLLQLNNVICACWALASLATLFPMTPFVLHAIVLASLLSPPAGMGTSIYLWYKGNVQAKYYTIAYLCLNIGTIYMMLGFSAAIERNWLTDYGQMIGFVAEFTLLSIALADRINRERTARETAQAEALQLSEKVSRAREEKLMIQEQVMAVQRQAKEDLELRVLERTEELERTMNNLELANRELSKLSFTDPLTRLFNRRYYKEILSTEIKRAARVGQPLSLAAVDIDHFKQINDTHGHLIGDECLRQVAKTLKRQLGRTSDLIARIGGEEFAIILPATPQENALIVANRAREAVDNINFIHLGERIDLSVSIGVAGWIPERHEDIDRIVDAAEQALARAKENGYNRTAAAG